MGTPTTTPEICKHKCIASVCTRCAYERSHPPTITSTDERYNVNDSDLHVHANAADDWEVWLNTEVQDYDGLCVGGGDSRESAIADAVKTFQAAIQALTTTTSK